MQQLSPAITEENVKQMIDAISHKDLTEIERLRKYFGNSWLNRIKYHDGDNIFHIIYKYVSGKTETWPHLKDFSDLIEKDGDFINLLLTKNDLGLTPIHYACLYGSFEDTEFLISSLAEGEWSEYKALLEGQSAVTKISDDNLLHNLDSKVRECVTDPVYNPVLKFVLGMGANVNSRDEHGVTPLLAALKAGNDDAVTMLVDKGADVSAEDDMRNNCLRLAVQMDIRSNWLHYFIQKGADANDEVAILTSVTNGNIEDLETLLENGGKVSNLIKSKTNSPFLNALQKDSHSNHCQIIQAIIDQYAEENGINKKKNKLILSMNIRSSEGKSALFIAAERGYRDVVSLLLKNGADPFLADDIKRTPSDIASGIDLQLLLEKSRVSILERNLNTLQQVVKLQNNRISALERKALE
jgi:ankyrin repeat protein